MSKYGPKAQLTAVTHHWGAHYTASAKAVIDGTWESQDVWGGIAAGMIKLAPMGPAVPKEVGDLAMAAQADIAAGKLHPFQGPVKDQSGEVVVPEGKAMSDEELLKMSYYVEGVQGKLPK
jgi:simple sugar transport system substrate-binding protein